MIHYTNILIPAYLPYFFCPCHIKIRHLSHNKMIAINLRHVRDPQWFRCSLHVKEVNRLTALSESVQRIVVHKHHIRCLDLRKRFIRAKIQAAIKR